jgi:hypothetical protein
MLKKLLVRGSAGGQKEIIVVSGLPRSGTSMMMKMLAEGGLQTVTDSLRAADDDNPNGYFEFEAIKQMAGGNIQWLEEARGRVIKVISALLEHLPPRYHYKVIFMERPLQEVLASQKKMLLNRSESSAVGDEEMAEQFKKHLAAVKYWLARQPNMEVLYMEYGKMLAAPETHCRTLAGFLDIPLDVVKMQAVPSEKLYRNRAAG